MEPPLPPLSGAAAVLLLLPLLLVPVALLARRRRGRRAPPLSLLVVAGSGGHTTEILRLLSCLSESYSPRHYIFADSDKMSEAKIRSFEQKRAERFSNSQFTLDRIPRSREVRQSWTSSVVTTLYSILYSFPLTYKLKPDLMLLGKAGVKSGKEGSPSTFEPPSRGKSPVRSLHLHSKYNQPCCRPPHQLSAEQDSPLQTFIEARNLHS